MATPTNVSGLLHANNAATSSTLSAGFTFAAGRHAVLQIVHYTDAARISGVTIGGSAAVLAKRTLAGSNSSEIWYANSIAGGNDSVVITYGGGTDNFISGGVSEWAAADGLTFEAASANSATGSSATPSVTTAASTVATNTVTFATLVCDTSTTNNGLSAPSGWTQSFVSQDSSVDEGGCGAWKSETSAGFKTATFGMTAGSYGASIASFAISAGGPTITGHPTQQSAAPGLSATFSVSSTGATSFQWQSAPVTSLYVDVPGAWADISGAVSSSYATPALGTSDNGKWFRVVVSDGQTSVTSEPARLFLTGLGTARKSVLGQNSLTGWIANFRKNRRYQSNQFIRKDLFTGDLDGTEQLVWGDFALPVSAELGKSQGVSATLDSIGVGALQSLRHSQSATLTLDDAQASIIQSGSAIRQQSASLTLDAIVLATQQGLAHAESIVGALQDITVSASQAKGARDQFMTAALADIATSLSQAARHSQSASVALDDAVAATIQAATHAQSVSVALADLTASVSETARHGQLTLVQLDDLTAATSQTKVGSRIQTVLATLDDASFVAAQASRHVQSLGAQLADVSVQVSQSSNGTAAQSLALSLDGIAALIQSVTRHASSGTASLADISAGISQTSTKSGSVQIALDDASAIALQGMAHMSSVSAQLADVGLVSAQALTRLQFVSVALAGIGSDIAQSVRSEAQQVLAAALGDVSVAIAQARNRSGTISEEEIIAIIQAELQKPGGVLETLRYIQTKVDAAF